MKKLSKKILCNCPCPGPFCNSFIHPCKKSKLHFPQIDQTIMEIKQQARKETIEEVRKRFNDSIVGNEDRIMVAIKIGRVLDSLEKDPKRDFIKDLHNRIEPWTSRVVDSLEKDK